MNVACENRHFSLPLAARYVSPGETPAPQRQKFHTDDVKSIRNLVYVFILFIILFKIIQIYIWNPMTTGFIM